MRTTGPGGSASAIPRGTCGASAPTGVSEGVGGGVLTARTDGALPRGLRARPHRMPASAPASTVREGADAHGDEQVPHGVLLVRGRLRAAAGGGAGGWGW